MARIKITDLPQDIQISREEMKKVFGGIRPDDGGLINPEQFEFLNPNEWTASSYTTNVLTGTSIRCAAKALTQRI